MITFVLNPLQPLPQNQNQNRLMLWQMLQNHKENRKFFGHRRGFDLVTHLNCTRTVCWFFDHFRFKLKACEREKLIKLIFFLYCFYAILDFLDIRGFRKSSRTSTDISLTNNNFIELLTLFSDGFSSWFHYKLNLMSKYFFVLRTVSGVSVSGWFQSMWKRLVNF